METCRVSDRPTLETAESGAAVLEALARAIWAKRHDGAECPAGRIPAPVDLFRWLPECPPSAWDEVTAAELAHGPGAVAWLSNVADVLTAANAPLRGGTFVLEHALADCSRQWRRMPATRPRHPGAPLVDAWQRLAPVPAKWDQRPHPVLPGTLAGRDGGLRPLVVSGDPRRLPLPLSGGGEARQQLWLGFERPEPDAVPVLPLVTFDARGAVRR